MAKRYAVQSGNWSDPSTWDGGTLPTTVDDVYANNKVVTIDYNSSYPNGYQVLSITNASNASAPTIAAGGYFTPANASKLTCTGVNGIYVNNYQVGAAYRFSLVSGGTATYVGTAKNVNAEGHGAIVALSGSSGQLNIIGNILPPEGYNCRGINIDAGSTATINITGNVYGGNSTVAGFGISIAGAATVNITGSVVAGSLNLGINAGSNSTVNVTGPVSAGNVSAISFTTGALTKIFGTVTASSAASAVVGSAGICHVSGPLISASNGRQPLYVTDWRWSQSVSPSYWEVYNSDLTTKRTLYTPDAIPGVPTPANVRDGTVYGTGNALTGSCKVPAAVNVRKDVPVDNTVGTAVLDVSEIWSQAASSMTVTGSIGERLKNAATVQDIGSIWAAG